MMKTITRTILSMVILGLLAVSPALAQQEYRIAKDGFTITIKGTSNVHDWTMEAEQVTGSAVAKLGDNGLKGIDKASITVRAKKLESGKGIMNRKTYDALETDDHPSITFELISVSNLKSTGNKFSGKATGTMKIAGESSVMSIPFEGTIVDGSTFKITGDFPLVMSDFGIDPPTAMLGSLKTGDKVTLKYEFTFNQ